VPIPEVVRPTPLPCSVSRAPTDPTIVTSSPSRIQTVPSAATIVQWKLDHGNRSSRAGIFVRIVPSETGVLIDLLSGGGRPRNWGGVPRLG
jgi:hypothetical protein